MISMKRENTHEEDDATSCNLGLNLQQQMRDNGANVRWMRDVFFSFEPY